MERSITIETAKLIPAPKQEKEWNNVPWFYVDSTTILGYWMGSRNDIDVDYPRPTQGHLQKYLRDEFSINVRVGSTSKTCHFYYLEKLQDDGCQGISTPIQILNYKVWEDALEAGLATALEYLLRHKF